jgi:polynucleotide 5'-kinase involved in rRNA processing
MMRGSTFSACSAYSIETDKDLINKSELMEEEVRIALVGIGDVGKSSMVRCIEVMQLKIELELTIS